MKTRNPWWGVSAILAFGGSLSAQTQDASLTLYNQGFALVRARLPIALGAGETRVGSSEITAHVEPESVILRDPSGKVSFRILEQSYRNDPVSQELLLHHFEGETIEFQMVTAEGGRPKVSGRIVRSGYVPHYGAFDQYGGYYAMRQMATAQSSQPIIEVGGRLRFGLPGEPLFPALPNDSILKPRLDWVIESAAACSFDAELAYLSGGFSWAADYNVIAPASGDVAELIGWVTMDNQSGTTFEHASLKLMAGDVNKVRSDEGDRQLFMSSLRASSGSDAAVSEKSFDEYHLYTVTRPTTLRDREKKQVEFVRAPGMKSDRFYVYDGAKLDDSDRGSSRAVVRDNSDYGTQMNTKVFTMLEFANSEANGLGLPLPKGRLRFYRRDADGRLEFTGEDAIDHTPKDETVRVYVGNSFDLVGERVRTDYRVDSSRRQIDESFRIVVRNHKAQVAAVRIVEHLYRWKNFQIARQSTESVKRDSDTIEFRVNVPASGEQVVEYTVHYTW